MQSCTSIHKILLTLNFHPCSEAQTKLLRLERDNRELERSLQVAKQTSERVGAEMEKTSRRLTAQIHADKKEIARLKEVSKIKCGLLFSSVYIA